MDVIDKSKALNILVPKLIEKNEALTKEMKTRIKLNKIFSEFENKASTQLNYFISNSSKRYNCTKFGNDLNLYLLNNRPKILDNVNKILNDKFYSDINLEKEKQKMKYKSTFKLNKDIKDTFNKIKIPLETKFGRESKKKLKLLINRIKNNLKEEDAPITHIKNIKKPIKLNILKNKEKIINEKNVLNLELKKDNLLIKNSINQYLNNINNKSKILTDFNQSSPIDILNSTPYKKRPNIDLPNLKLINYSNYKPVKKKIIKDENKDKPDIKKLLPYTKMGKHMKNTTRIKKKELSLKDIENNKFPFLTETDIYIKKNNDYGNTLNIVYNSANKELEIQKNFDRKRRKINDFFGINNIPQIITYDEILFRKSDKLKKERQKRAEKLNNSQKYEALSEREKAICIIDKQINKLNRIEKYIDKKFNRSMKNLKNE